MNDKKQHEQRQDGISGGGDYPLCPSCWHEAKTDAGRKGAAAYKRPWHAPALERLRVSVDTKRGSGGDFGVETEIFGG